MALCIAFAMAWGCGTSVAPSPPPAPADRPDPAALLRAVRAEEFEVLEETMRELQERWGGRWDRERALVGAWMSFGTTDPSLTPAFDHWVEERPESYVSHLARAEHYSALGWRARGGKDFASTPASRIADMERELAVAVDAAGRALARRAGLVDAHRVLIDAARASQRFGDCRVAAARAANAAGPASFQVRYSAMLCRLPEWGGGPGELQAFAEETEEYEAENPYLFALRGFPQAAEGRRAALSRRHEWAIRHFRKATRFGGYPALHLALSQSLWQEERYAEALVEIDLGLRLSPDSPALLEQRVHALARLGRADEVEALYERLAAIDPAGESLEKRDGWLGDAFDRQGYELLRQQRYEAAIRAFDRVASLRAPNATLLINRGQARAMLRQVDLALADFEAAARLDPRRYEAYVGLDRTLAQRRDWSTIVGHWERYLELVPDDARAYLERAGTYNRLGNRREEQADLEKACGLGLARACQILGR